MSGGEEIDYTPVDINEILDEAVSNTEDRAYETELERMFQDSLKDFNDRDVDAIGQHLENIRKTLSEQIDGVVKLRFGGSVGKHTYVDGLSDVDMLVSVSNTSLANKSPQEVLDYFVTVLRKRLPNTKVEKGKLAVTISYRDGHDIQLLPAIQTKSGYRISRIDGSDWSNVIAPRRFAKKLTESNQALDGKLIRLIKLIKPMNDKLPAKYRLSGYHIESIAIESFDSYSGRPTFREMIQHFWNESSYRVLKPIVDSTGQSRHVDEYLGDANSDKRQRVANAITNLCRSINNAEKSRSVDDWRSILEP